MLAQMDLDLVLNMVDEEHMIERRDHTKDG